MAMDPRSVALWIDGVMVASNVTGALLIDAATGLCLGAGGKAIRDDAPALAMASRTALDARGVGAVLYRDSKVILRRGAGGLLVAVFKQKDTLEEMPDER